MMHEIPHPHLHIEFYMDSVKDKRRTREEGRPIYKDVPMFRARIAGDPTRTIVAPAHDKFIRAPKGHRFHTSADDDDDINFNPMLSYAEYYHEHWAVFQKENAEERVAGTPLHLLTAIPPYRVRELEAKNVFTIEQLASLADRLLKDCGMTTRDERDLARAFLDSAAQAAAVAAKDAENASLRAQMDELRKQVAALMGGGTVAATDDPSDDDLRQRLAAAGMKVRANASREKMLQALAEIEADTQVVEEA